SRSSSRTASSRTSRCAWAGRASLSRSARAWTARESPSAARARRRLTRKSALSLGTSSGIPVAPCPRDHYAEDTMGVVNFVKKQFIDILQWTEASDDVLAWRFPTADFEIQQG